MEEKRKPKMFLLFSHTLTGQQEENANEVYGVEEFVYLPNDMQHFWSNIPPEITSEELMQKLAPIISWVVENHLPGDIVLVHGEPGATVYMTEMLVNKHCVYATTRREAVEITREDDSIEKKSVFRHCQFRDYPHI